MQFTNAKIPFGSTKVVENIANLAARKLTPTNPVFLKLKFHVCFVLFPLWMT